MTAGCPCLLRDARNPQIRRECGRRVVLTWTCKVCGERNTETSEYPPQRSADVFERHGGPLTDGNGSSGLMDSNVHPPSPAS